MANGWIARAWLLWALLAGPATASERRYFFEVVDPDHALASQTVNAILQDHVGYLWVGTQSGLDRYDGYHFLRYEHVVGERDSLPESFITALAEDARGRIWVGSATRGLAALDPVSGRVVARSQIGVAQSTPRDAITALRMDAGQRGLWIGKAAGLEWMDLERGLRREVLRLDADGGVPTGVADIALAADGDLWVAASNGLWRVASGGDAAQPVAANELSAVLCVLPVATGAVYVGNARGLYTIDREQNRAQQVWQRPDSRLTPICDLAEDRWGRVWLSVFGLGVVYQPSDGRTELVRRDPLMPGGLPDENVRRLLIDHSGLLWLGGDITGLAVTSPAGAQFRYVMDPNPSRPQTTNAIRAITEDGQGRLWLGTNGDGLKRYEPTRDAFEYFDDAIAGAGAAVAAEPSPAWHVLALTDAGDGKLWVASNRGAYLFDPAARRARAMPVDAEHGHGLPESYVRSVLRARDGSVWFGTYNRGLAHWLPGADWAGGRWELFRHRPDRADSLGYDRVLALAEDDGGRIWIGTGDGLSRYDPARRTLRTFRHEDGDPSSLADDLVRVLAVSEDGGLWIGTQSGLDHIEALDVDRPRFQHYGVRDGLPGSTVLGILEDHHRNLWVSTNAGIAAFDRALGRFLAFAAKDGLQGAEFNAGAAYRRANGELVFGGLHGLNRFDPDTVGHDTYPPPVVVTAVTIGDRPSMVPAAQGLRMAQEERWIRFEFAALDFAAPSRNRFAYRLQGFDPSWIDAGRRHVAVYTNLPAGRYRFEVRGSNADGIWNPQVAAVDLEVQPPWWASGPMRVLYVVLVFAALAILSIAYRQRRQRELAHHRELRAREDRLRMALWGSGDEFWDLDLPSACIRRTVADREQGEQREETLSLADWRERLVHPDDQSRVETLLCEHLEGRRDYFEAEYRQRNAEGEYRWILARGKVVERDASGAALRICGTARDVTAERLVEADHRIASEVIDSMSEAVSVTDLDFRFVSINRAFTRMFGYGESEVLGQSASILNSAQHPPRHYQAMREALLATGRWRGELWQRRKNGEEFWSFVEISEVKDAAGRRTHFVGVTNDITERKRAEQELRYLANYDTLTGLPNRALLGERLAHAVIRARRTGRRVAVLFLDMDRFKHVNDSMGHAVGDRVLKAVGERLRDSVRESATVARLGGDEFTVVLEDIVHPEEPERIAEELLEVFSQPLELESGQQVVISPSIGISLYPDHAQVPTDLIEFADTAMYQAKEAGRNMYMVYTPAMDATARQRASMLSALRLALERNELRLVYQPILDLDAERITGVEALVRWHHPEFGEVAPSVFIPLAEEAGLIERIGEFVLYHACAQLPEWEEAGLPGITMSVNLSTLQLLRHELTRRLCEVLAELRLAPQQIELELTESVLMANPELAIHTLDRLHALGVRIAIDDFGTGYSSLSYLRRLPIDTLKIDRSFVGDITSDPDDEAITKTIISMAHSLGLDVIAEGVETPEQLEYLREHGCDAIQGNWLSPPLPASACLAFIRDFARRRVPSPTSRRVR
jgi:diguanylate cyclase (GGDEF)-like protein/PAS domain S-box-containing protein